MKKIDFKDKKTIIIIISLAVLLTTIIVLFATGTVERFLAEIGLLKVKQVEPKVTFYEHIPKGDEDVYIIEDRILIADKVGVACYNAEGEWQWEQAINLKAPVFVPDGDSSVVLGDIGGNGIYGFDKNGLTWRHVLDDAIVNISGSVVNKQLIVIHGVDNYLSAATLIDYSKEDKVVASRKFSKYYMMSASISEDGQQAVINGIMPEDGKTSSVMAFMKMKGYELFATEIISGEFLPIVSYIDNEGLFAVGGDSLRRIVKDTSLKKENEANDLLWEKNKETDKIVASAKTSDGRYITVSAAKDRDVGAESSCVVNIYAADGSLKDTFTGGGNIKGVKGNDEVIALYSENDIFVYNIYGQLIGKYSGISQICDVEFISERILAVCGTSKIAKVDFS